MPHRAISSSAWYNVEHLGYLGNSIAGYPGNLGAHMGTSSLGELKVSRDLQPRSITMMEVSFSRLEFGATLPKPTLVSVVKMKYILVMYRDCRRRERTKVVSKRLFSERGGRGARGVSDKINAVQSM